MDEIESTINKDFIKAENQQLSPAFILFFFKNIYDFLFQTDFSYITSFLGAIHIPKHKNAEDDILDDCDDDDETLEEKQKRVRPGDTSRANTREELQQRLQVKIIIVNLVTLWNDINCALYTLICSCFTFSDYSLFSLK